MNKLLLAFCFIALSVNAQAQFWSEVDSDFPVESTGISRFDIVDESIAWGIGYNGINPDNNIQQFSITTDAGLTWNAGSINIGNVGLGIGDIAAINDQIALIAVYPRNAGQQGGVWKTTDAGATWNKATTTEFTATNSFANTIHFFDASNGVVMGDPINNNWEIYTTNDAGATFSRIASSNIPVPQTGETGYLAQKTASGNSIWFTTSAGRIYHSADQGLNWNVYQSPIGDFGGETVSGDLSFSDATKGILQTQAGILYSTADSGETWSQITISGTGNPYGDNIAYLSETSSIVSVGSNPSFSGSSYSLDDGLTWINIDNIQHVDIAIFDRLTGYSGGFTSSTDDTGVFRINSSVLSSEEFAFAKAISLYPNPTKNRVNISGTDTVLKLELFNLSGQMVKTLHPALNIVLDGISNGLYFIKITTDLGTETLPIIKE